ncbi:MAG: HAMP domain-containing histidine kinase [Chloroflexi bacterium]|nr:HAMP domain-containing histidine kinase [Chloroflexota bacterium]
MARPGLWLRVFIALLVAVIPPLFLILGAAALADALLETTDATVVGAIAAAGATLWAAILSIFYERLIADSLRSFIALAEHGDRKVVTESGDGYGQLADSLKERNRQVAALASSTRELSIDEAPESVVAGVVAAVRSVMGDPTWRCAVLASDVPDTIRPGIYHAAEDQRAVEPIGDLERWAAVSASEFAAGRIVGPWGAFMVIRLSMGDRVRGILYAPWEGRPAPTPVELDLLTLAGQHASTAIEHSLLYAQVRTQADELNRMAGIQADFLRGVTHDLQTPLTSIGALATELRADPSLGQRALHDLESIVHQAERLRRMVSQLLIASRLEAGALTSRQEVFAVPPLVERTWSALRADRPFELIVEGAPHLAVADPDRLEQVLWALVDNAVKYSPPGSPVEVIIRPDTDDLTITVRDHGIGMDEATRARAFEQFFRADAARRLAPDGSGVGLYAVHGLMRTMGGSASIETKTGHGTAITLRVPAEPSSEQT